MVNCNMVKDFPKFKEYKPMLNLHSLELYLYLEEAYYSEEIEDVEEYVHIMQEYASRN